MRGSGSRARRATTPAATGTSGAMPARAAGRRTTGNPIFGGRAWTWDPATRQYYHHLFVPEQPDLNWRNPEVRAALWEAARFWLDRGVDGFRLDVFNAWYEHPDLPDNPLWPGLRPFGRRRFLNEIDQPEMHGALAELRSLLDAYPDRASVGEPLLADLRARSLVLRRPGPAHGVQLRVQPLPVERSGIRRGDRAGTAGAARGRLAVLGAGQPRPEAPGLPPRRTPPRRGGPRGCRAAAHAARHTVHLLRRGTGPARRAPAARPDPGPAWSPLLAPLQGTRRVPGSAAVERRTERRVHDGNARGSRSRPASARATSRCSAAIHGRCGRSTATCSRCAAPRPHFAAAASKTSERLHREAWHTCGATRAGRRWWR